jgi:hypothetical protein
VINETVLIFPVGGLRGGGNYFGERSGHGYAEFEAECCGKDRIYVLSAEDYAADFWKMRGDRGFEPRAVQRGRDDQVGLELLNLGEQSGEFGSASGGFLFERIEAGDVPV